MDDATSSNQHKPIIRLGFVLGLLAILLIAWILTPFLFLLLNRPGSPRIAKARMEMDQICNAAIQYRAIYSSLPISTNALSVGKPDYTFGSPELTVGCQGSNAELMAILMDLETFRNGQPTVNTNHALNPQKTEFLAAKEVNGPRPGIDEHGVYRDPWANPYIITLDVNGDDFCEDPLFGKVRGKVFVWSFGPDGKADLKLKPDEGVNADNLRSDL